MNMKAVTTRTGVVLIVLGLFAGLGIPSVADADPGKTVSVVVTTTKGGVQNCRERLTKTKRHCRRGGPRGKPAARKRCR